MAIFRRNSTPIPSNPPGRGTYRGDDEPIGVGDPPPPAPVGLPVNTVAPSISGDLTAGSTLTATAGTWTGNPTIIRAWLRDGVVVSGRNGLTYLTSNTDVDAEITYREYASTSAGTVTADSNALLIAGPIALPGITSDPFIQALTLPITVGVTLIGQPGNYTDYLSITRQWYREGQAIAGATSIQYIVANADVGNEITFAEIITNADGSVVAVSEPVIPALPTTTEEGALQVIDLSLEPVDVSVARNTSGATYRDENGNIVTAAANVPRYHYNSDGTFAGLYVEPARTNYLSHSQRIGDTAGSYTLGTGVTVTLNAATSPAGDTTASRIQITAGTAFRGVMKGITVPSGSLRCSVWLRNRGSGSVAITLRNPASGYQTVSVPTTWTRFDLVGNNEGGTWFNFIIFTADAEAKDIEAWLGDVTAGGVAGDSLIVTGTGGTQSRASEVLTASTFLGGTRDIRVTFSDNSTQNILNQSLANGVVTLSASQLTKTLIKTIEVFATGTIPAASTPPPPAPPASEGFTTQDYLLDGMTGPKRDVGSMGSPEAPGTGSWGHNQGGYINDWPDNTWGGMTTSHGITKSYMWWAITDPMSGNPARNDLLYQVRYQKHYVRNATSKEWTLASSSDDAHTDGFTREHQFNAPDDADQALTYPAVSAPSGGTYFRKIANWSLHGYPMSFVALGVGTNDAHAGVMQVRCVPRTLTGTATAGYPWRTSTAGCNVGMDNYNASNGWVAENCHGAYTKITNRWLTISCGTVQRPGWSSSQGAGISEASYLADPMPLPAQEEVWIEDNEFNTSTNKQILTLKRSAAVVANKTYSLSALTGGITVPAQVTMLAGQSQVQFEATATGGASTAQQVVYVTDGAEEDHWGDFVMSENATTPTGTTWTSAEVETAIDTATGLNEGLIINVDNTAGGWRSGSGVGFGNRWNCLDPMPTSWSWPKGNFPTQYWPYFYPWGVIFIEQGNTATNGWIEFRNLDWQILYRNENSWTRHVPKTSEVGWGNLFESDMITDSGVAITKATGSAGGTRIQVPQSKSPHFTFTPTGILVPRVADIEGVLVTCEVRIDPIGDQDVKALVHLGGDPKPSTNGNAYDGVDWYPGFAVSKACRVTTSWRKITACNLVGIRTDSNQQDRLFALSRIRSVPPKA